MELAVLRIENFRAVERAELHFQRTTVLIGENDSGRSSVIEALALALGWNAEGEDFAFAPFHFRAQASSPGAAPPVRLRLEFAVRDAAEPEYAPVRRWLPQWDSRRLYFEILARPGGVTSFRFSADPEFRGSSSEPELLRWLRRHMPVIRMGGGVTASRKSSGEPRTASGEPAETAGRLQQHYDALLGGEAADPVAHLDSGYRAARDLIQQNPGLLAAAESPLGAVLREIAGSDSAKRGKPSRFQIHGTAAQRIGVLLLLGALMAAGRGKGRKGAAPLIIIEDPEAHLHPMTLASVWGLLERIPAQQVIGTHSETLLASAPLASVRRMTRSGGEVREWRVPERALSRDELRRYAYHLRSRRGGATFSRCWLLVEGETEFWILPELARICGHDLAVEGVSCVEFAQCGLPPLVKVAHHLGIEWHLLTDGDRAGQTYAASVQRFLGEGGAVRRISVLAERDIENCFWRYGYADIFRKIAYPASEAPRAAARVVIDRAIHRTSKPQVAVALLEAAAERGPDGVPPPLRRLILQCIEMARSGYQARA